MQHFFKNNKHLLNYKKPVVAAILSAMWIGGGLVAGSTSALADRERSNKLPIYLDAPVDATAQDGCAPGQLFQGSGNPATTFQRVRDLDDGVELAIKAIVRQGPDIRSTFIDDDGLVHIEVPTGTQPGNPSRAAWNFTYSYNVALDPSNPILDQYESELWIDLDPSRKTDYLKLKLARLGPSAGPGPCNVEPDKNGYGWKSKGAIVIGDDEGTDRVTQNSQNLAFYASQIDTDRKTKGIQPYTFGPGQFDVVMISKRKGEDKRKGKDKDEGHGGPIVLHVVFDVVAAPTQP